MWRTMAVRLWLISDTHFGHANILTFSGPGGGLIRPEFGSAQEMDTHMVERWNAVVRPQDHVYHLGDVCMKAPGLGVCSQLQGHKRLVRGNHDIFKTKFYLKAGFEEIHGVRVLGGAILSHIPLHPGSIGRFKGNVHGHLHANPSPEGKYVSVCVERRAYTPVLLDQVVAELEQL